jgi:hypothetical protein
MREHSCMERLAMPLGLTVTGGEADDDRAPKDCGVLKLEERVFVTICVAQGRENDQDQAEG